MMRIGSKEVGNEDFMVEINPIYYLKRMKKQTAAEKTKRLREKGLPQTARGGPHG